MSTPVLSLLIALITVATAAAPVFVNLSVPKNSNLRFHMQGHEKDELFLWVVNSGVRPGVVRDVLVVSSDGITSATSRYLPAPSKAPVQIDAGASRLITLRREAVTKFVKGKTTCILEVSYTDFAATPSGEDLNPSCFDLPHPDLPVEEATSESEADGSADAGP